MAGTLFVVATPIGNLEDITLRALRTLREVQLIAAEDTRRTAKLLSHFEIRARTVSLREHNEARESARLVSMLQDGEDIALVSDAGTPGISDPGVRLVRAVLDSGLRVVPIPGPSAVLAALSSSGLPADRFTFLGFPPRSGQARVEWLETLQSHPWTVVFFEAPHRIKQTLDSVRATLANRPIVVWREISKIYEEMVERPIRTVPEQGEFTVVVGPAIHDALLPGEDDRTIGQLMGCMTEECRMDRDRAVALAARAFAVTPTEIRRALKRLRYPPQSAQGADPAP
jgi:16S rRNA (cytidine1402-2'-O)-methyltransferase